MAAIYRIGKFFWKLYNYSYEFRITQVNNRYPCKRIVVAGTWKASTLRLFLSDFLKAHEKKCSADVILLNDKSIDKDTIDIINTFYNV